MPTTCASSAIRGYSYVYSIVSSRPYVQRRRAESTSRTRDAILDAAASLAATTSLGALTVSAIADRAGVQRLTVYRHFGDEAALLAGLVGRWRARAPFPAPESWAVRHDPRQRLRTGLDELYAFYERDDAVLVVLLRDRATTPGLSELLAPFDAMLDVAWRVLLEPWGAQGRARAWIEAMIAHAVRHSTWRSLAVEPGGGALSPSDAARVMSRVVAEIARDPYA
jgi:AcrR family transcriptional regulator